MFEWLKKRAAEPSSYLGLALLAQSVGILGKVDEAAPVAAAVGQVGEAVAAGTDPLTAAFAGLAGILGVFLKEKGRG